jgi:hypothetical protein
MLPHVRGIVLRVAFPSDNQLRHRHEDAPPARALGQECGCHKNEIPILAWLPQGAGETLWALVRAGAGHI